MRNICRSIARPPRLLGRLLLAAALSALALIVLPSIVFAADYTVQRGDTLGDIADRFGTTARAIASQNSIRNPDFIQVGQRLRLPSGTSAPAPTPAPPTQLSTVVKSGDTLIRIAQRLDTSVDALVKANGIRNPDRIYVGQTLYAPGGGRAAPAHPAAASG